MREDSQCDDCIHLLHYKYDREVYIACELGHDARLYPPKTDCDDCESERKCWNCKYNKSLHDGIEFIGMCGKDCMNLEGVFDWEYHKFKEECVCPFWRWDER